ncbi:MAG: TetR/AcrR family transcriptional regulator [Pseudomonadales bacterium]|nr:TetR/AcrR family transcriptional regulator [Pseudomonadales bacterium]
MNTVPQTGPGRPRSEEAEKAILDATLQLLADKGYNGLTVDKVAALASVSKSTMYRRWPSKLHLVIAAFSQLPQLPSTNTGNLLQDLVNILESFLNIAENTPLAGVLATLAGEQARNHELSEYLLPLIDARRKPVRDILQNAMQRHELPEDLDLELAVDMVMGPAIMRMLFTRAPLQGRPVQQMLEITLRGLGWLLPEG